MLPWIISVFLLATSIRALGHPKYECGEHGRFEYCIDGIPGCIVGCHCHPGYYFDTETKICEPNAKLVQDYRRLYSGEPTRIPLEAYSLDTEYTTTLNPIEPKIDNIAKDADDLGDWLYNQFFKTIEGQVTNKTETERPPTRRSESGPGNFSESINKDIKKKSGRRKETKSHKKLRAQSRKDKKRKEDLRRKLLRISEDDSLFDSSESQDTSTDSSGESDYSDTSDSEGTSYENSKDTGGKHNHHKDGEHGHRKILMINKKPKPPLPSFIFLPQFETPFYPPIGLPPPVMPMFPMVPVPPMPPFPYPVPHPDDCDGSTTPSNRKTDATDKPDTESPDDKTTSDKPPDNTTTTDTPTDDTPAYAIDELPTTEDIDPTETPSLRNSKKKKNLRSSKTSATDGKMKKRNKHKKKPITPHLPDPFVDMYTPQDFLMKDFDKDNFISKTKQVEDGSRPGGGDVDFKYLAQLIHKMGPNDTKKNDDTKLDMVTPFRRTLNLQETGNYRPIKTDEDSQTQRNFDTRDRNLERHDDLYYTKLGHQIASLIRNIDSTDGRRSEQESTPISNPGVGLPMRGPSLSNQDLNQGSSLLLHDSSSGPNQNPYLYKKNPPTPLQPILYETYGPRSYWERSVRSLINNFHRYPEVLDLKADNLYKLENRLITVASTERPLSLTELENILTVMAKAKTQLQKHTNDMLSNETGNENLNVNLLPQHMEVKNSAQNDNTFHRFTKTDTPIIAKEIHINSDEMVFDEDEVTNFNFPPYKQKITDDNTAQNKKALEFDINSDEMALDEDEVMNLNFLTNKKKITDYNTTRNRKTLPNITTTPAKTQLTNVTPNKKQLVTTNLTHKKKQLKNVRKSYKKKVVKNFNVSPTVKSQINLSLPNITMKSNKTNFESIKNEIINFDDLVPTKKELSIFNFIPNLKETVKTPPYETNTLITNASKDQQQLEARSMINNVRRNLQGVLLQNFRNIPALITNIPKVEIRKYKNSSHINVNDILKLQRLTTNKLNEITNARNHLTKVTWITPKVAQFITNPDRPLLQPSDIKQTYRKTSIFPSNRPVFIEKPLRFELPVRTQVFRRPQSFFKQDVKGSSYFSHQINLFE